MSSDHLPKIFITPDEDNCPTESMERFIGENPVGVIREEEPKDAIEVQLQKSAEKITVIIRDGTELVTNVIVAIDRREIQRRIKEASLREELLQILQAESELAMKKFREISHHWDELDEVKDPFNMNLGLEEQKFRIDELMAQKDAIILECRRELQNADECYRDQERHAEDLECIIERINSHVETMKKAYGEQLERLQQTITEERSRIKEEHKETWTQLFDQKREHEQQKLVQQSEQLKEDDVNLERLVLEHEELIHATKSRLEVDNECLQLELQKTKANVLLNTQKLDYNFEVLKRREEESVRNQQQKKRLTKLHDTIAGLKKNLKETVTKGSQETNKLRMDIEKLKQQIRDLESSAVIFAQTNDQNYKKTWEHNQDDCMNLMKEIRRIDLSLSKNELELNVTEKEEKPLLQITDLKSFQEAVEVLESQRTMREDSPGDDSPLDDTNLRQLFDQILDQTGFIHEKSLVDLLENLQEEDSKLIKFSNLLNMFGIKDLSTMNRLERVFKKYMWCIKCTSSPLVEHCDGHEFVLESDDVLPALFEVRRDLRSDKDTTNSSQESTVTLSRLLDTKEVEMFWNQFQELCPQEQEQLWNGLEYGLKQYLSVLRERETLFADCEQMRQQNLELERLLENYK